MADSNEVAIIETCVHSQMLVKQMAERMLKWYDQNEIWVFERNMKFPGYCDKLFAALLNEKETVFLVEGNFPSPPKSFSPHTPNLKVYLQP